MDTAARTGNEIRWHYTIGHRLKQILEDGEIRPATAGVPKGEKPAVWFSVHTEWEPTANKFAVGVDGKPVVLTREQTEEHGGGLCRIGVAPATAPYNWDAHKLSSGITASEARRIYQKAIAQGARPGHWFTTYSTVPRSQWLAVEVYDNARWVPYLDGWLDKKTK